MLSTASTTLSMRALPGASLIFVATSDKLVIQCQRQVPLQLLKSCLTDARQRCRCLRTSAHNAHTVHNAHHAHNAHSRQTYAEGVGRRLKLACWGYRYCTAHCRLLKQHDAVTLMLTTFANFITTAIHLVCRLKYVAAAAAAHFYRADADEFASRLDPLDSLRRNQSFDQCFCIFAGSNLRRRITAGCHIHRIPSL